MATISAMNARANGDVSAPDDDGRAPYWSSVLLVLLSCSMLFWTFQTGLKLGMADTVSQLSWARSEYSTAIAISRLQYGVRGYLIASDVWRLLSEGGFRPDNTYRPLDPNQGIANALGRAVTLTPTPDNPDVYLRDWGDDKGGGDYFIIAFALFGFQISSLYYLYFLILALSLTIFSIQYFRNPHILAIAPMFLAAHHEAVTTLPDSLVTSVVHDAHFLAAMACLATLHIAILLLSSRKFSIQSIVAVVSQLFIIMLVIDSRRSLIWLIYFPIGAFIVSLAWRWRCEGLAIARRTALKRGYIVVLLLLGPFLLNTYQNIAYDRAYTVDGIQSHNGWHPIFMGLSVHPDSTRYGLAYTDSRSFYSSYEYLITHPDLGRRLGIDVRQISYNPTSPDSWVIQGVGYRAYEEIAKENLLDFIAAHPLYTVESFILFKPIYLVEQLLWQMGFSDDWPTWVVIELAHTPASRHLLAPFSGLPALVVLASVVVAYLEGGRERWRLWVGLSAGLLLASLVPSIAVAPIYYELQIVFLTFSLFAYALGATGLVIGIRLVTIAYRERTKRPARAFIATGTAIVMAVVIVGVEARTMLNGPAGDAAAASPAMVGQIPEVPAPGRLARSIVAGEPTLRFVRDSLGQIWLLHSDSTRHLFTDWGSYLSSGGDASLRNVQPIDDRDLLKFTFVGIGVVPPELSRRQSLPNGRAYRGPGARVTYGPVDHPAGSRNLALGRTANMNGNTPGPAGLPAVAVDGNTSGRGADNSIATTTESVSAPWWQIDLGADEPIGVIAVWPRTDECCVEPLNNFLVFVSSDALTADDPYELSKQPGVSSVFVLGVPTDPTTIDVRAFGRYVRIQMAHPARLDLAEVEVWSDPSLSR